MTSVSSWYPDDIIFDESPKKSNLTHFSSIMIGEVRPAHIDLHISERKITFHTRVCLQ